MTQNANLPLYDVPFLGPDGKLTEAWWIFLLQLFNRSGGSSGTGNIGRVVPVTVGISPFIYKAPSNGVAMISAGGISNLEYTRGGVTWYQTGMFRGAFPMAQGDALRITHVAAPSMIFAPNGL